MIVNNCSTALAIMALCGSQRRSSERPGERLTMCFMCYSSTPGFKLVDRRIESNRQWWIFLQYEEGNGSTQRIAKCTSRPVVCPFFKINFNFIALWSFVSGKEWRISMVLWYKVSISLIKKQEKLHDTDIQSGYQLVACYFLWFYFFIGQYRPSLGEGLAGSDPGSCIN